MLKLKIGENELSIKFGYKPTLKERVISKVTKLIQSTGENNNTNIEFAEDLLLYLPELILVGLQVCHEEYRYNYDTKEGKEAQLEKVFDLVDQYSQEKDSDLMKLFNDLYEEMQNDSFLSSLFRSEQARAEAVETSVQKAE